MALLIGRFVNKIDGKGRVSVPKPFRDFLSLQNSDFAGVYAFPHYKSAAIEFCGRSFMRRLTNSIDVLDMFSDERDDLASILLENAYPLAYDPEGRITLPKDLIVHACLDKEALFVGRSESFLIWDPALHKEHTVQAFERARANRSTLKLRTPEEVAP